MHHSTGILRYSLEEGYYRLVVDIDPQIAALARALAPKALGIKTPRYHPHITVVRNEPPVLMQFWGRHQGERIHFSYSPEVQGNGPYYWLNCYSERLLEIRLELGLKGTSRLSRPPSGEPCFHTTIGNTKPLDKPHRI